MQVLTILYFWLKDVDVSRSAGILLLLTRMLEEKGSANYLYSLKYGLAYMTLIILYFILGDCAFLGVVPDHLCLFYLRAILDQCTWDLYVLQIS